VPVIGIFIAATDYFLLARLNRAKTYTCLGAIAVFTISSITYLPVFKDMYVFYKSAIKVSPHSELSYKVLAKVYTDEKKCSEALYYYKELAEAAPGVYANYGFVGNTYLNCLGDPANAVEWYQKAINAAPDLPTVAYACITLGDVYYAQLKDMPKATYWYARALKADSSSVTAINGLGNATYSEGAYAKAINYYLQALQLSPTDNAILLNLAYCYMDMNDSINSAKYAKEYAMRGQPIPPELWQYLEEKKR
jgi:tetratricopeptide (TPR) repeat protein